MNRPSIMTDHGSLLPWLWLCYSSVPKMDHRSASVGNVKMHEIGSPRCIQMRRLTGDFADHLRGFEQVSAAQ